MLKIITSTLLFSFSALAFAKSYSNISLEVLGYDSDKKAVLILENSASYDIPRVYRYSLSEKRYDLLKYDENFTGITDQQTFQQKLSSIKTQLKPLKKIVLQDFNVNLLEQRPSDTESSDSFKTIYGSIFTISSPQYQSLQQNLTSYSPEIKLKQAFELPKNKGVLITFESLSLPFDEGYSREEAVVLFPTGQLPK
ncbi:MULTISPECIES: hypothetical protein [Acinetobacter]|uniref:hypothetical protein n=1 Tax=Acinetobacter TaxID=469 RepID=UPI00141B306B|nr:MULTISPECIES: hypothetical protein [Acinetobacter]MCS4296632.1 hypothetical protein [Acinetobacter guillouiae]MCW2250753.1 hypothetical protein [Acinetobacter sp. BIGb0204]NII37149.1 hypothetical protein [Acinetobacter sp. BIGb0196]